MDIIAKDSIMSRISSVAASARTLESDIHQLAYSTLDHIRDSGDYRGAVALLNALPKGQRVQALAAWYRHFSNGKITLRQDASKTWICALKDRTETDFDMEGAEGTTYADLTNEAAPKQLDVAAFVKRLEAVSTNDSTITVDGVEKPKVTPATRSLAAQVVAFVRGLESQAAKAA